MTDTPDLHTLAAKAMCNAFDAMPDDAHRPPPRVTATTFVPPPEPPCASCLAVTDAVLAAVLSAHRRQVQRETIQTILDRADRFSLTFDGRTAAEWLPRLGIELPDLASAAPETAPTPRQNDETAPAVPEEAAEAQGPAEGDGRVSLAEVLDALRDPAHYQRWDAATRHRNCFVQPAGRAAIIEFLTRHFAQEA